MMKATDDITFRNEDYGRFEGAPLRLVAAPTYRLSSGHGSGYQFAVSKLVFGKRWRYVKKRCTRCEVSFRTNDC
jgi:hypothetical protein